MRIFCCSLLILYTSILCAVDQHLCIDQNSVQVLSAAGYRLESPHDWDYDKIINWVDEHLETSEVHLSLDHPFAEEISEYCFEKGVNVVAQSQRAWQENLLPEGTLILSNAVGKDERSLMGKLLQQDQREYPFVYHFEKDTAKLATGDKQVLYIDLSDENPVTLTLEERLRGDLDPDYAKSMESLPISYRLDYDAFQSQFRLQALTTEQSHPETKALSQKFIKDTALALEALQAVDQNVLRGAKDFMKRDYLSFSKVLKDQLNSGGRVFFLGSGSSGRVGLDLAAKWNHYWKDNPEYKDRVIGVIAGGARAFVKAKEGFEDSVISGEEVMKDYKLNSKDVVVLISGSGSAKFNVGGGKYAAAVGAKAFYFYNSQNIPKRTSELFENGMVTPLLYDIGPQAISGSTRLQAASIAELCLGMSLEKVMGAPEIVSVLEEKQNMLAELYPDMMSLIDSEIEIFSHPDANFRRVQDDHEKGYVTFVSQDALREIMIDSTETAPTFSTNPPRGLDEQGKKRAEFRAYFISSQGNLEAWKSLVGREITAEEANEVNQLLITTGLQEGVGSFKGRPTGEGNLCIAVLKSAHEVEPIRTIFQQVKEEGGKTALIAFLTDPVDLQALFPLSDSSCVMRDIPKDPLGLVSTLLLKQSLNMISNASMLGMNKVYGNTMIDVSPANNKLIDRTIRIISNIYAEEHPDAKPLSHERLFHMVVRSFKMKRLLEEQHGVYIPTSVRTISTMLAKNYDVETAISVLRENNEDLSLFVDPKVITR